MNLLLSGPAGGVAGIRHVAAVAGIDSLLSFDMGGTSTDVAMVSGEPVLTSEARIGPWPVAIPMLDIHTIGAGGGSIARLDAGGALQVGPASAGADPGPACYGRGGTEPTVTDAHVVLGHLPSGTALGGSLELDADAARAALDRLARNMGSDRERAAEGILEVANEHMAQALRVMSVERGQDPREPALCCFGGAGGLHLCAIADRLGVTRALVPIHGGVLSALGMLVARPERQLSRTLARPLSRLDDGTLEAGFEALAGDGRRELMAEGQDPQQLESDRSLDLRYAGQAHALNLPWSPGEPGAELARRFHEAHAERYGHALETEVELVNLRLRIRAPGRTLALPERGEVRGEPVARVPVRGCPQPVPVWPREALGNEQVLHGPAIVTESTSTTWIAEGWMARTDARGNLHLLRDRGGI